jgi:hypothetical protein
LMQIVHQTGFVPPNCCVFTLDERPDRAGARSAAVTAAVNVSCRY